MEKTALHEQHKRLATEKKAREETAKLEEERRKQLAKEREAEETRQREAWEGAVRDMQETEAWERAAWETAKNKGNGKEVSPVVQRVILLAPRAPGSWYNYEAASRVIRGKLTWY